MKYTDKERRDAVLLAHQTSVELASMKTGLPARTIYRDMKTQRRAFGEGRRIAIAMHRAGKAYDVIAEAVGVTTRTIRRWVEPDNICQDDEYLALLRQVMTVGVDRPDRTGTGTRSLFGERMRFDLRRGFPLLTTKRVFWRGAANELLWMLTGSTNVRPLQNIGVHIWDEWADDKGNLGPVYGAAWRRWEDGNGAVFDQIERLVRGLRTDPNSRRHVVSAWMPTHLPAKELAPHENARLGNQALAPCHCLFQFYVAEGKLSCQLYQRSGDLFLGVPFNIASYSLLTHMLAHILGLDVGYFTLVLGDVHIYHNHFDQVQEQLDRKPRPSPSLRVKNRGQYSIDDFVYDDFDVVDYNPHPTIKAPVAV